MNRQRRKGEIGRHVRRKSGTSVLESAYAAAQNSSSIASSRTTLLASMAVVWVLTVHMGVGTDQAVIVRERSQRTLTMKGGLAT